MQSSLLAFINLATMLVGLSFLAQAIARQHWQRGGSGSVVLLILMSGQIWLIPQAISFFAFHSTRLLYALWFGNWIILAVGVILFCLTLRGRSRDLFDAAQTDGLGFFGIYRHLIWPTMKKELLALAILLVMATWVEFASPALLGDSLHSYQMTLPIMSQGIAMLIAASCVATLPAIAIYFFSRRPESAIPDLRTN